MITPHKTYRLAEPPMLFAVIFMCIMTASGQGIGPFCQNISIGDYANMSFSLPAEASVRTGSIEEVNYSQGKDVNMPLLLNNSSVRLQLHYACGINAELEPSKIRSLINAFDPQTKQATYSSTPLSISGHRAVWGELKNRTFAAYQPSNRTIAVISFDEGLPYGTISSFLNSLQITINESNQPQMYCPQSNASPHRTSGALNLSNTTAKNIGSNTAKSVAMNVIKDKDFDTLNLRNITAKDKDFDTQNFSNITANDTAMNISKNKDFDMDIEAMMPRMEVSQEALMAEQEAAKERMESSAEKLKSEVAA